MTNERMQCPKCNGQMVQGFVPDYSQSAALVAAWHLGQPQKSFWTKTKVSHSEGLPIGAFRCQRCGYLEFYADARFAAE